MRRIATLGLAVVLAVSMGLSVPARAAEPAAPAKRGVCVVVGDRKCELTLRMAPHNALTYYVQLASDDDVLAARRAADEAGLLGTRVYVAKGEPGRIALADNLADLVFAHDASAALRAELLRVLQPGGHGVAGDLHLTDPAGGESGPRISGEAFLSKPVPDGADDWSHPYHGPDNNPQSDDRLAKAPYLTQFVAEPRYGPAPQAGVAAGGRIFMAFGHVAWHRREEPWMNTLVALNGYNGAMLWKRPLPEGIMVDRSTMIATPTTLYLADGNSCKLLDPATGEVDGEIRIPAKRTGGTFWKWMALDGDVLYALVGPAEPADEAARWRRGMHGWPWTGISKGYNDPNYPWGFAPTLTAIDPKTKKVLWQHTESGQPIDGRGLCMKAGRVFVGAFGKYLACLDAKTGKQL